MIKLLISIFSILTVMAGSAFAANGLGYWQNHDSERESVISVAVSDNIDVLDVFSTENDLRDFLTLKKSKSLEKISKQHLAVLLLNLSAGYIDPLDNLTTDELAILQTITPTAELNATIGEAIAKIENAIKTGVSLEEAKNLSEILTTRQIN